ncbi:Sec1-binding region of Mso1-domain-containing protein [Chaetomium fimeti]|uniref:Sec1-binding region of Mso1-domain-containing protein n=1 Tax=Chaetomium fimeti TaxID=1854472 RepID=A0AAE0HI27_9PEZI|nr:Sec1-binding region of Mso1-domain-containing protein [Chaetomium fimeti]
MASWYKDLLTSASSGVSRLQRTYFGGESDGDTDDDTHVCRVLRGYYAEKGQALPAWLPPDPRAPPPQQQQQPVFAAGQGGQGRYGGLGQQGQFASSRNPFAGGGGGGGDPGQRPGMGGQRAGSYQTAGSGRTDAISPASGGSSGGVSAQEKLKQRLWGGARTTSPSSGGPFQPPVQQQQQQGPPPAQQSGNRWGWGNQGGSGGDGGDGGYGARRTERPVRAAPQEAEDKAAGEAMGCPATLEEDCPAVHDRDNKPYMRRRKTGLLG